MSIELPLPAGEVLEHGVFCHLATVTPAGPHVTPMVFAAAGGRIWVTTARGSVKARAWHRDPAVAGVVRHGTRALVFRGSVETFDLLDPATWARSVRATPILSLASARFTKKNARFFAGYAVDAHHVPFAWSPPGRVFAALSIERAALLDDGRVRWSAGGWGADPVPSRDRFRASSAGAPALDTVPTELRSALGETGRGVLATATGDGPALVPVGWVLDGASLYAAATTDTLELAGFLDPEAPAALEMDRPSSWRARAMVGAMARGDADVHVLDRLSSGSTSAKKLVRRAGLEAEGAALVRLRPSSFVWWRGWTSGTVTAA